MLSWIVALLFGERLCMPRHVAQRRGFVSLTHLTELTSMLLIARAGQLAGARPRANISLWRRGRDMRRSQLLRAALGSRLRRALKDKHIGVWLANLIAVLRDLDAYAAPLARRLRRGLTRFWRVMPPIGPAAPLRVMSPLAPAFSDSS